MVSNMSGEQILVVDDDVDILELVRYNLEKEGFHVLCAASGEEALARVYQEAPDLIVLDLMLPNKDGLEVCRELKSHPVARDIPLVMLTAKSEEADVVAGLEIGADDYITKPFSPRVLVARIKAALRKSKRTSRSDTEIVTVGDVTIDPVRFQVWIGDRPVDLTVSEFRILHLLARNPGWVYTRDQIIVAVKGEDYPVTDRSVDVQVVGLRKKLGEFGYLVETVRGVGYRFKDKGGRLPVDN